MDNKLFLLPYFLSKLKSSLLSNPAVAGAGAQPSINNLSRFIQGWIQRGRVGGFLGLGRILFPFPLVGKSLLLHCLISKKISLPLNPSRYSYMGQAGLLADLYILPVLIDIHPDS